MFQDFLLSLSWAPISNLSSRSFWGPWGKSLDQQHTAWGSRVHLSPPSMTRDLSEIEFWVKWISEANISSSWDKVPRSSWCHSEYIYICIICVYIYMYILRVNIISLYRYYMFLSTRNTRWRSPSRVSCHKVRRLHCNLRVWASKKKRFKKKTEKENKELSSSRKMEFQTKKKHAKWKENEHRSNHSNQVTVKNLI